MAQDMNDPAFKRLCHAVWKDIAPYTTIDNFNASISIGPKVTFLGYADITIGFKLPSGHISKYKLRGIEVKQLNGKPKVDAKSTKGEDGNWYPPFFPMTAVDRAIYTTMIFSDARVKEAIAEAARQSEVAKAAAATPPLELEIPAEVLTGEGGELGAVAMTIDNPFEGE